MALEIVQTHYWLSILSAHWSAVHCIVRSVPWNSDAFRSVPVRSVPWNSEARLRLLFASSKDLCSLVLCIVCLTLTSSLSMAIPVHRQQTSAILHNHGKMLLKHDSSWQTHIYCIPIVQRTNTFADTLAHQKLHDIMHILCSDEPTLEPW